MSFEYRGHVSPVCGWLHVDAEALSRHTRRAGWDCRVVHREENGDYLAQLTQARRALPSQRRERQAGIPDRTDLGGGI
jgi:hypothetical protein